MVDCYVVDSRSEWIAQMIVLNEIEVNSQWLKLFSCATEHLYLNVTDYHLHFMTFLANWTVNLMLPNKLSSI